MFKLCIRSRLLLNSCSHRLDHKYVGQPLYQTSSMATDTHWLRVNPKDAPSFSVFTKQIQKSEQDDREYQIIRLENGLQATLIHDAKADKAAASLDVAVGHLHDPDDMPGLAHFCEHLLFMGTEQYPKENEYSEYLAKNNGSSNAYTSTSNTNYFFSVAVPALGGALERFSAFFHSPLFAPSCTSRELNAVDSEHKKNHQSDMWRFFQLSKHLSKHGHVWRKFGSGNRSSLSMAAKEVMEKGKLNNGSASESASLHPSPIPSRLPSPAPSIASQSSESDADGGVIGRETRRRLVEWWSKEYCASRMHLCIIGKDSLDDLAKMASTLFSRVPNHEQDPLPMFSGNPLGPNEKGTLVSAKSIMSFHAMEISFPLEYQIPLWKEKPGNFISHFVGHEGPGSLHSYLKTKGWVTTLSAGSQPLARGLSVFKLTLHLTEEGFRKYRDIILVVFKYLTMLRESKLDSFYEHQRELVALAATRFRFSEKRRPEDYATWVAEHMAWPVPRDLLISAPQLVWDWGDGGDGGAQKVKEYLDSFRIEECRVMLMAKGSELTKVNPHLEWKKEPWYGTEYAVEKFDHDFTNQADVSNDIAELFLPGRNEFIPTNLDVDRREGAEPLKRPHLIRETPMSTLWHKKDDRFWVPKAHVIIDLRSPAGNASAREFVLTRLYSDLVNDSLTEFSYDADLAGLSYTFSQHSTGLFISMNGYNDKMQVLVKHILEKVKGLVIDPARLAVMKEQVKREWENFFLGQPYMMSDIYGRYVLTERQWSLPERLEELPSVTAEEIQHHTKFLLSQVNLRILVVGNVFKDEAIKIAEMAERGLGLSSLAPIELNDRALILPRGINAVWSIPIPNLNQPNSALTFYVHFGPIIDQHLRVTSSLLTQILSEPAFNVLRTQEQLGYVVSCGAWALPGSSEKGLRIVVQSERQPVYLEERVEAFLDGMKSRIEGISVEDFESQKSGLSKRWLEADKNLSDETARYMVHVNSGQWDFFRNEKDAELLKGITKHDILSLFLSHVHPASPERAKLSIHMLSQKPQPKNVSAAALREFEELVHQANLGINASPWGDFVEGGETPTLMDFGLYWKEVLAMKDGGLQILGQLPAIMEKYPVETKVQDAKLPGVTYIDDIKAFKASLKASTDPGPMVQWGDLPLSKF